MPVFSISMLVVGIFFVSLAFLLYESEEKRIEGWVTTLWIKIDDYAKTSHNWFSRIILRFAYFAGKVIDQFWGKRFISFRTFGASLWLSWCWLAFTILYCYCRFYFSTDLTGIKNGHSYIFETSIAYFIPFFRQFDINVFEVSAEVSPAQMWIVFHDILFNSVMCIWYIFLCIIPNCVKLRYWITAWLMTFVFICIELWVGIGGASTEFCIKNNRYLGKITSYYTPYPTIVKFTLIITLYVLASLLISIFAFDLRNVFKKYQNLPSLVYKVVLRLITYATFASLMIVLVNVVTKFHRNYFVLIINGSIHFMLLTAVAPIQYFLVAICIILIFIPAFKIIIHFINRHIYALLRYKVLQKRKWLASIGIVLIIGSLTGKSIAECCMHYFNK